MTESEIVAAIRRGIREPTEREVKTSDLVAAISRAVRMFGLEIESADREYYLTDDLLTSNTNVFSPPSSCRKILRVWDLRDNALVITDATNATPIVVTSNSHGLSDDDVIKVFNVGGNTAANGVWKVANATDNTIELYGSEGNAAYTSGGTIVKTPSSTNGEDSFSPIEQISYSRAQYNDDTKWFLKDKKIVINNPSFTNDILIDFTKFPTEIDDIPVEYQDGIVAFGVINYITMPSTEAKDYESKVLSLKYHSNLFSMILSQIRTKQRTAVREKHSTQKKYWL